MSDFTKNGLLLLMISLIISIISAIITGFLMNNFLNSIITEDITSGNILNNFMIIIPALISASIGGIILLIAVILIFLGRKEFGEKHHKFIKYAIFVFIIYISVLIFSWAITQIINFTSYNPFSEPSDPTSVVNSLNNTIVISAISGIIGTIIAGLITIFGLYQLENNKGKKFLYLGYASSIVFSVIISLYMIIFFDDIIGTDIIQQALNSESTTSTSFSSFITIFQGIGDILIISIIGGTITNIFYIISIYIPYKRIKTGDLLPELPSHLKRCANCGKASPADSLVCAYCGKSFNNFVKY
jgi:hypothetical protein